MTRRRSPKGREDAVDGVVLPIPFEERPLPSGVIYVRRPETRQTFAECQQRQELSDDLEDVD